MPMLVIALLLFIGGLAAGSFINALVWRLHQQSLPAKRRKAGVDLSVLKGRSVCPSCEHRLAWYDLVPLLSWLMLHGQCRYCKKPVSAQYPVVELLTGLVFASSYVFWPVTVSLNGQWLVLSTWTAASVGLIALAAYDIRWLILPNRIIYPTLALAVGGRTAYVAIFADRPMHEVIMWALSLVIASGVFFALFFISNGKWIGYGDVRLGLITGTLLADPQKSLAMIFIASLIGTLAVAPSLFKGEKNLSSRLPYGPFLIAATAIMMVFGDSLLSWYKGLIV